MRTHSSIVPRGTSFHCWVDLVDRDRLVKNPLTVSNAVLERIACEAARTLARLDESPRLLRLVDHRYLTIHQNIRASLGGCH